MQSIYYTKKDSLGVVMFMGRKNCSYSKRIKKLLKNNSKNFIFLKVTKLVKRLIKSILNLVMTIFFVLGVFIF